MSQVSMNEKRRILCQAFEEQDLSGDRIVNLQTLQFHLQQMNAAHTIEHDIIEELFNRADKQQAGQITVYEFINVLIEADQVLTRKIEQAQNDIQADQMRMEEQKIKLQEIQQIERYNNEGIAIDSVLNVDVYQAQIRSSNNLGNVLLHLECNNQQHQTHAINSQQSLQWNKSFQFRIDHKIQNLTLRLMKEDQYNSAGLGIDIAFLDIQLVLLEDQQKRDEWLDMKSSVDGQIGQYKVRVSIQWIHSKVQLLKDQLSDLNQDIQQLQQDIVDDQMNQQAIYAPFKAISQNNLIYNSQQFNTQNFQTNNNIQTQNMEQFLRKDNTYNAKLFTIGLIVLCLISSFARSQYLDLTIGFSVLYIFYTNQVDKKKVSMVLSMFVISFILDFIWLYNYTSGWWNKTKLNFAVVGLRRTVLFISYVIFLYKLILLFIFFSFSQIAFKQNQQQNDHGSTRKLNNNQYSQQRQYQYM